jgi:hypothetical protein
MLEMTAVEASWRRHGQREWSVVSARNAPVTPQYSDFAGTFVCPHHKLMKIIIIIAVAIILIVILILYFYRSVMADTV